MMLEEESDDAYYMTIAKTDPLLTEKQQLVTMIYKNF